MELFLCDSKNLLNLFSFVCVGFFGGMKSQSKLTTYFRVLNELLVIFTFVFLEFLGNIIGGMQGSGNWVSRFGTETEYWSLFFWLRFEYDFPL